MPRSTAWLLLVILASTIVLTSAGEELQGIVNQPALPPELGEFINAGHSLPRFEEAFYSPLGRNPVVDACLGDPFYLPSYGMDVSREIRTKAQSGQLSNLLRATRLAGGYPVASLDERSDASWICADKPIPAIFIDSLGEELGYKVWDTWCALLWARERVELLLQPLSDDEQEWLAENPDAYFFGEDGHHDYDFFTTDSDTPLRVFALAAKIDLAGLAAALGTLTFSVDKFDTCLGDNVDLAETFRYEEAGALLVVSGKNADRHDEDCDLLIDLGGDDIYLNNAGGTQGERPAALLIDLSGNDRYESMTGGQGAGLLGVGGLVDLAGNDTYIGHDFCQGAAMFGAGFLFDLAGDDEYITGFFGQGAAAFGFSLLWDAAGADRYNATGMAQAAASTLGAAFMVEGGGDDNYRVGGPHGNLWTRGMGNGQGFAIGNRYYPWKGNPSFYGGVAFLDDAGGDDDMYCGIFGQGSSYFLSLGVLINSGGNDRFVGQNSQGEGLHLSAGLMVKEGGDDHYDSVWGGQGCSGDRSVGMLIDTGGNDTYVAGSHNLGTSRKPKSVALFADLAGDDTYSFSGESAAHVQRPSTPDAWPWALFLDLGGNDTYPELDDLARKDNLCWEFEGHGNGVDDNYGQTNLTYDFFSQFPAMPRIDYPFDPLNGWQGNVSHRALIENEAHYDWEYALISLPEQNYHERRATYERIDLVRFLRDLSWRDEHMPTIDPALSDDEANAVQRKALDEIMSTIQWSPGNVGWLILSEPETMPDDALVYAALRGMISDDKLSAHTIPYLLQQQVIADPYTRKMLIAYLGSVCGAEHVGLLGELVVNDPSADCRLSAAFQLGKAGTPEALLALLPATSDPAVEVRYSALTGLRDSSVPDALDSVLPYLADSDLYVRRAAAMTAISLEHIPAIPVLLDSCKVSTLDTGYNYGSNLFATLGGYVGGGLYEEYGVDLALWLAWWGAEGAWFRFPAEV